MTPSDKFTGSRRPRTHGDRHRRRAYVKKKKNKSMPRTRKEKCQTAGADRPNSVRWRHQSHSAYRFELGLRPVSVGFSGCRNAARLTFLTAVCQKCQTISCQQQVRHCRGPPRHHAIVTASTQV